MLAAIKMEVMIPSMDSHDEGCLAIEFHMLTVSSQLVRPDWPAEEAPVIAKQLSDVILSSGMINLKELSLISGKAACHGLHTWTYTVWAEMAHFSMLHYFQQLLRSLVCASLSCNCFVNWKQGEQDSTGATQ